MLKFVTELVEVLKKINDGQLHFQVRFALYNLLFIRRSYQSEFVHLIFEIVGKLCLEIARKSSSDNSVL